MFPDSASRRTAAVALAATNESAARHAIPALLQVTRLAPPTEVLLTAPRMAQDMELEASVLMLAELARAPTLAAAEQALTLVEPEQASAISRTRPAN